MNGVASLLEMAWLQVVAWVVQTIISTSMFCKLGALFGSSLRGPPVLFEVVIKRLFSPGTGPKRQK